MINRPIFLNQLINFKDKDFIKVITGIRRCGKSSLLQLFADYLKSKNISDENIIQMNFESFEYDGFTYKELYNVIKDKSKQIKGKLYLLFDEIQRIKSWELAVNSLRVDCNVDIYITGSNAYLLSSQLATYLSGRYVEIKMQPLTFKEFLTFYDLKDKTKDEKFALYLKIGGMPGLKGLNFNETMINQALDGIYSTVIMKDVINQSSVRDPALLNKITSFLADNIGNATSVNNIKNTLVSDNAITKGTTTGVIDNYIKFLENAFIFYGIKRYDIKGKEYLKTQGKYYIADIGIRTHLLGERNWHRGHILENIIYLELLRRGYDVYIGKIGEFEVDFIAQNSKGKVYFQVALTVRDEKTLERELRPLKSIRDHYPKFILTLDEDPEAQYDGIRRINARDWLLGLTE